MAVGYWNLVLSHKRGWRIWVCRDAHSVDVGQSTIQGILCEGVFVLVQNLFESLEIRFIVEGIRLTQDLLNLCVEPGVGFFCSEVI